MECVCFRNAYEVCCHRASLKKMFQEPSPCHLSPSSLSLCYLSAFQYLVVCEMFSDLFFIFQDNSVNEEKKESIKFIHLFLF